MKYHYHVVYAYPGGIGSVPTSTDWPLDSSERVDDLCAGIERKIGQPSVIVTNWILLRVDE